MAQHFDRSQQLNVFVVAPVFVGRPSWHPDLAGHLLTEFLACHLPLECRGVAKGEVEGARDTITSSSLSAARTLITPESAGDILVPVTGMTRRRRAGAVKTCEGLSPREQRQ
eukprot:765783-Hanusia_phi.AAC.5